MLVQATPDRSDDMTIAVRRDSFCGKMSCCNNMMQYGIAYSLTTLHTESLTSPEFKADLEWFSAVCRIVKGLKNLKIGAIGARPAAFNTVRYSERILETAGISIEPLDLSEVFGRINHMKDSDDAAQAKLAAIKSYVSTANIPEAALLKMAKLGAVIDGWMKQTNCTISAVQCWTSMEEFFGVVPCTIMSMMSNNLIPVGLRSGCPRHAQHVHAGLPARRLRPCSIGTITTAHIPISACASIAPTCRSISSRRRRRWTSRQSLPARSARRTPSAHV